MIARLSVLLILMVWMTAVSAMPQQAAVPGGIKMIALGPASQSKPAVRYQDKPVLVTRHQQQWQALVGIPLSAEPGPQRIHVKRDDITHTVLFDIADKAYPTQHITIENNNQVSPDKQSLERISQEIRLIREVLTEFSELEPTMHFIWPVDGEVSGLFGRRRVFNGEPRKPHSGIDIAARTGTPIVAPADGVVSNTGDYFFNGNSVFIDHGQGVITMFCHLQDIDVQKNQLVTQGEQIGTVGETGRVTGPHLHLGISFNDAMVEPLLVFPPRDDVSLDH